MQTLRIIVFFLYILMPAFLAQAGQPYLVSDRSPGLIWRLEDVNGDGDALDVGERTLWGEGFGDVVEMETLGRAVYAVEDGLPNGTDKIYLLEDLNHDGDALDLGEMVVWADGFTSPRGIARDDQENWYVTDLVDGNVLKLVDLNADGDVLDVGEKTLYAEAIDQAKSPLWLDGQLLVTAFLGDAVYGLTDLNGDGDALDVGENLAITPTIDQPLGLLSDGNNGFFFSSRSSDTVYHAEDQNGDGDFLDLAEVLSYADGVFGDINGSWSMTEFEQGGFLLADYGDGQVVWVDDQTGDGDALDLGEVTTFADGITLPVDIVQLVPEIYNADYDDDEDVDGFDFLKWQRGESPLPLNGFDFNLWESQFGAPIPLAAVTTGVPEPSAWTILALGLLSLLIGRRTHPSSES